ncbi:methyltransferase domain-containing protein [Colletotrichum salicis]|uniref:Methyltransferase domain-containing protein n=1 Tax=Colletotrichum salicis TaxID=1209931 RepID=A0A135UJH5_9PEZI|nr:methyltransferase domain-containing protein [Colletotrichum salicis]
MTTTESKTASLAKINRVFWESANPNFLQSWTHPRALSPYADSILGIDVAPAIVQRYNECAVRLGYAPAQVHAVAGDLSSDVELANEGVFDVVIISMALHHLDDPLGMLKLLAKRVRVGGVLIAVEGVDYEPTGSEAAGGNLEKGEMKGEVWSGGHGGEGRVRGTREHGVHKHEARQHDVLKTTNQHLVFSDELFRGWFRDAGCDEGKFVYVENEEVSHVPEKASGKAGGLDRKMVIASSVRKE